MTSQDDNHKTWTLGARISRAPLTDIGKKMTHPGDNRVGPWVDAAWMRRRAELNFELDQ